jgi:hypothetical protein
MSVELIGYIVSGAVSLLVCLVNNYFTRKQTEALILYRIEQLEKSVSRHNNLIERMYKVEQDVALHDERISNLEKGA